jgi:hypothetical protein
MQQKRKMKRKGRNLRRIKNKRSLPKVNSSETLKGYTIR